MIALMYICTRECVYHMFRGYDKFDIIALIYICYIACHINFDIDVIMIDETFQLFGVIG